MSDTTPAFDHVQFKATTRDQWDSSGSGYNAWGKTIHKIISQAVDRMVELTGITSGSRVLELAAGSGVQTMILAGRVGADGAVCWPPIFPPASLPSTAKT